MKKILLIDDSPDNLVSLKAVLKDLFPDTEVLTALTGKDGIELAAAHDPDVILLDVLMPEMDGFNVCRNLKLDTFLRNIPIVFITALDESKENRLKAIDAGVEAFLHKPIDEADLFVQVNAMFKIREANLLRLEEFSRLEELVKIRTEALEKELLEKEQLNQQLIESEERFRSVFEASNVGKSITRTTGEIFVNQAFCDMIGYTKEELNKRKWQEITPSDEIAYVQKMLEPLLNGEKEAARFEKRYIHKNGCHIWADANVAIKLDSQGIPQHFITTILDISDRKKIEQKLKESELNARAIMESTDDVILLMDKEGILLDCNESQARRVGSTRSELIGKSIYDFLPFEIARKRKEKINEAITTHKPVSFEDERGGYTNEITIYPIFLQGDATDRVAVFARNISNRKRDEVVIKENEAIFSQFMEHSPVYVFFKDDQIRSLRLSRNYEEMLGRKLEELLGKNMDELFPSDLAKEMVRLDQQILAKGEKVQVDEVFNGRNYTTIKFPIQVDGEHRFLAGYTIDITDRKAAEDALRNSEIRLIELNATKDKFFSIISHDLKSPFNSLLGFSNLLVDQIEQKDFQGIEEYARIIQISSRRIMDLLENLLQWSRSQIGRIDFSPEFLELGQVVKEVTELLNDMAVQKTIFISNTTPPKTVVFADKRMLGTILRNLISNAIKFTHPGGTIHIDAEVRRSDLLVSVADTGVGIPKEQISKLFRIEESFSMPGTLKEHGTGLGLILCKDFVEKHGGRIWVESASKGQTNQCGSTFKFTIPIQSV